jgi:hypothetical protein
MRCVVSSILPSWISSEIACLMSASPKPHNELASLRAGFGSCGTADVVEVSDIRHNGNAFEILLHGISPAR